MSRTSLARPQPPRQRSSSSTALRQPLSLDTLTVRATQLDDTGMTPTPTRAALSAILSHLPFKPTTLHVAASLPPSPTTPTLLPVVHPSLTPELSPTSSESETTFKTLVREATGPLIAISLLFPLSTAYIFLALKSLPIAAIIPKTLDDLSQLGAELQTYSDSSTMAHIHVLAVLSVVALWKHAWSVPGSVLLNMLAGVLLNPLMAAVYMTFLTSLGSLLSTLLALPLAPLLSHVFPHALSMTRAALQGSDTSTTQRSPAWARLAVLRLVGVIPWSGLNVACGAARVSFWHCFLGALVGTLPWTAVTVQVGDILHGVATTPGQTAAAALTSPAFIAKLALLTLLTLGPIVARDRLRGVLGDALDEETAKTSKENRGWTTWIRVSAPGGLASPRASLRPASDEEEIELLAPGKIDA